MNNTRITFIGAGNMATSLIRGLISSGYSASAISASDPLPAQISKLNESGINLYSDNNLATNSADVVVLAVKPQNAESVLRDIHLNPSQLLISIAAGISLRTLQQCTSEEQPIVRCMPNTPALVGAGITAMFANHDVSPPQKESAENILGSVGKILWIEREELLDVVTALSGSGPAYFFYLIEALIEAGEKLGLDPKIANVLALETAYGSAKIAIEQKISVKKLRENVTSPGGTTEKALAVMENAEFKNIVATAVEEAANRSKELASKFAPKNTE
tara:strand:- start:916 stop:1740 length:825 start_codon:yes stop_codon:yes gene_type:complete